jgi:hypothetical protein
MNVYVVHIQHVFYSGQCSFTITQMKPVPQEYPFFPNIFTQNYIYLTELNVHALQSKIDPY